MAELTVNAPETRAEGHHLEGMTTKFKCRNVKVHYGDFEALHGIDIDIPDRGVTAFIGPSGCGKSTFLRTFNRMNDSRAQAYLVDSNSVLLLRAPLPCHPKSF